MNTNKTNTNKIEKWINTTLLENCVGGEDNRSSVIHSLICKTTKNYKTFMQKDKHELKFLPGKLAYGNPRLPLFLWSLVDSICHFQVQKRSYGKREVLRKIQKTEMKSKVS
ncbi:hypothetical protein TNIN_246881 [Trichonephila inaurata madagascariensis]|uniref:Uncharacterized protein n=1 Tax=Trichonephila inaurata madagascariensis TaxID=2747483 RepID=A0A8X6XJK8_9ARAC|nr:hypothetical protein TNIN_246881 [Trichonephila inaurata madagascariensis]